MASARSLTGRTRWPGPGLSYPAASANNIREARAVVMIDRQGTQDWGTAFPSYIQVDGLERRGAQPSNSFTNSKGTVQAYESFGACLWVERGHKVALIDNVLHDCSQGLTYIQSVGVVYAFNHYGPLHSGAGGNAIKDRSVGTVVRFNRIEEGARSLDLVEAEDDPITATSDPAYRTTYVHRNEFIKSGLTGSLFHYGGDHFGSDPTATWGEPIFRKGTLYFFNNTVYVTTGGGALFQLSTTEETAEVFNNVFHFASLENGGKLRMGFQDVNTQYWIPNGIIHLGRNWFTTGRVDTDVNHPLMGSITGTALQLTGTTMPFDLLSFVPVPNSSIVDAALPNPSALAQYPVDSQLGTAFEASARTIKGAAADLGAVERP